MSVISQVRESRELVRNLTAREVKGKYKSTALGQTWSLITPIATMATYTLVFGFFLRFPPEAGAGGVKIFAVWLMCALLPWGFFTSVVNGGISSLVSNDNLIKKVYFPRWALPISTVLAALNQWGIEMVLLSVVMLIVFLVAGVGPVVLPWLPLVVVAMALLAVFALGMALTLSIANVYFRDTQHFVSIALQIWFYLTPIIYPVAYVDRELGSIAGGGLLMGLYKANPMYGFAEVFRDLLYRCQMPSLWLIAECVAWAAASICVGVWVFRRCQGRLVEAL